MKKIFLLIILLFSLFLTGCGSFGNVVEPRENSITLTFDDDYSSFFEEELPSFTFNFNGTLNVISNNPNKFYVQFSNNEDKILSDALNELFTKYKDRMHVELVKKYESVDKALFSTLNEYGTVINQEYTPDDYAEYDEIAFIDLENGLKLKIEYRRFIYNGENYYTWSYRTPLSMVLVYPFMVLQGEQTNRFVLINLPTKVAPNIYNNSVANKKVNISNLINGSAYTYSETSMYYTYGYVNVSESKDEQQIIKDNQQFIIDYYVNNYNGEYKEETNENNELVKTLTYSYLGNDFLITLYDTNFKMKYVGKTQK